MSPRFLTVVRFCRPLLCSGMNTGGDLKHHLSPTVQSWDPYPAVSTSTNPNNSVGWGDVLVRFYLLDPVNFSIPWLELTSSYYLHSGSRLDAGMSNYIQQHFQSGPGRVMSQIQLWSLVGKSSKHLALDDDFSSQAEEGDRSAPIRRSARSTSG